MKTIHILLFLSLGSFVTADWPAEVQCNIENPQDYKPSLHHHQCSVKGADFSYKNLEGVTFFGADLSHANFTRAIAVDADFKTANLREADFAGADLRGAQFAHISKPYLNPLAMYLDMT